VLHESLLIGGQGVLLQNGGEVIALGHLLHSINPFWFGRFSFLFVILLYHTWGSLSRGFSKLFEKICQLPSYHTEQREPVGNTHFPLTLIIIADYPRITIGKIHKIGKSYASMFVRFVN
jgi:hypothetical protein